MTDSEEKEHQQKLSLKKLLVDVMDKDFNTRVLKMLKELKLWRKARK